MATALKMAAICMLALTMGQLMSAVCASGPLVHGDAAPSARRLLAADHERPASNDISKKQDAMMLLQLLQKKGGCPCSINTLWCCDDSQKTIMLMSLQLLPICPCDYIMTPWCCFAGSAAKN